MNDILLSLEIYCPCLFLIHMFLPSCSVLAIISYWGQCDTFSQFFLSNLQQASFNRPITYAISKPTQSALQSHLQINLVPHKIALSTSDLLSNTVTRCIIMTFPKILIILQAKMKRQAINQSTLESVTPHPQPNLSQVSPLSMTIQQRKLYEKGLYFPEEILCEASVQFNKGDRLWTEHFTIQLTTQSFGQIPLSLIQKIKLYHGNEDGIITLKIMVKKENFIYKIERKKAFQVFTKVVWSRLATMNLFSQLEEQGKGEVDGTVYKRSEYLKCWEAKSISASEVGLKVFKSGKEEVSLKIDKTPELWTRFQTIKQERFLVVKLWRGVIKEQIGLPIQQATKWLQALCHLLG